MTRTGNQDRRCKRQRPLLQLFGVGSVSSWHATPLSWRDNTSFANREKSLDSSTSARIA
jgi:hypothetical protein